MERSAARDYPLALPDMADARLILWLRTWGLLGLAVMPGARGQDLPARLPPQFRQRPAIPTDQRGGSTVQLSLADCLTLGDNSNIDLGLSRFRELVAREDQSQLEADFAWEFFMDAGWTRTESPVRNDFSPSVTRNIYDGRFGLRKKVVTGGTMELAFTGSYTDQKVQSAFAFPSTFANGDISLTLTQPLLRGAWVDYNLSAIEEAKLERMARVADQEQNRQSVLDAIATAYFNLIFTREDWVVRYLSLELSREQLRNTEEKIRLGELAPRARVADQAEVARKEEELISAETRILDAEDALRRLILPFRTAEAWDFVLVPTDRLGESDPTLALPDPKQAFTVARVNRPDLLAGRRRIEAREQQVLRSDRDLLPGLDLSAVYSADAQADDLNQLQRDLYGSEYPDYGLRLAFTLPIGNQAARARYNRARLELEETRRSLQILEIDIEKAVRETLRQVQTLSKSIAAARESVRLATNELESAQIKLDLGQATQFEVQSRTQDLQDAWSRLIRSRLDYRIQWFHLQAVQGTMTPGARLPE